MRSSTKTARTKPSPAVHAFPCVDDGICALGDEITVIGSGGRAGMVGKDADSPADRKQRPVEIAPRGGDDAMLLVRGFDANAFDRCSRPRVADGAIAPVDRKIGSSTVTAEREKPGIHQDSAV